MTDKPTASGQEPEKTSLSLQEKMCLSITGAALVVAIGYMLKVHQLAVIVFDILVHYSRGLLPLALIGAAVVCGVCLLKTYRFLIPYVVIIICSTVGPWLWYYITTSVTLMDGSSPIPVHAGYFVFGAALAFSICVARHVKDATILVFSVCLLAVEFVIIFLAAMFTDLSHTGDRIAAREMAEEKFSVEFPDNLYNGRETVVIVDYRFDCSYRGAKAHCRSQ